MSTTQVPDCPTCKTPMEAGRVFVQGTALGFLAFGLSYQHLWFESPRGKNVVLKSSTVRSNIVTAHRCNGCGSVLIAPPA